MNWQEALEEIQSVEFDVDLNVVSSANAFFRAVAREPAVLEAYRQMRELGELREDLLGRIYDLAAQEIDLRYENPNDTPLAVFLWLTYFGAPDFAPMAAGMVGRAPQCWYAWKLVRRILSPPPAATGNYLVEETVLGPRIAGSSSGNVKVTMAPVTGNAWKVYQGKATVKSTTPVIVEQMPDDRTDVATVNCTRIQLDFVHSTGVAS